MNATAARPKLHPGDDDPSLTAHAGLALVGELVARIGLVEGIDARLGHLKARRRGLSPGQFVVSMAESVLAGGSHLSDVEALRADGAGASLRAVANPPAPSTAGQLFSRFKITDCWKLERASAEAANGLDKALGLKPGTITLDADSTTCQTFGAKKKGTGWSHNGVRGYQPFVISWSERRRFLAADLLAANNNPVASSPRLLRRALTLLPDGADGVRLRGDSGFYSADLMAECARRGVRFSICAKRTTVVWAEMLSIPKGAWRRAKDMRRAQVAETTHEVAGVGTCRLIVRRVEVKASDLPSIKGRRRRTIPKEQLRLASEGKLGKVYCYSAIVTDLEGAAVDIEAWHRCRVSIEELFKDAKHGHGLAHLPMGRLQSNAVWMQCCMLAVNLSSMLQQVAGTSVRAHAKRLRSELLCIPARLVRSGRQAILRFGPGAHKAMFWDLYAAIRAITSSA